MRCSRCSLSGIGVTVILAIAAPAILAGQTEPGRQGQTVFEGKCAACHSLGNDRTVGPGLEGISERRDRGWLKSFIIAPDRMLAGGDPIASELLAEYQVPMPNLGVSEAEAESILDYLAAVPVATTAPTAAPAAPGDAALGRMLFTGERRFENRGAACISCHTTAGLGRAGGGTLSKDLTHVAATYGNGLRAVLEGTPFPVMQEIFGPRPLMSTEVADLAAFLVDVDRAGTAPQESRVLFPLTGLGGMLLLTALSGVIWRRRLRGVRKPLIGGRR